MLKINAIRNWCEAPAKALLNLWIIMLAQLLLYLFFRLVTVEMFSTEIDYRINPAPLLFGGWNSLPGLFSGGWIPSIQLILFLPFICYLIPKLIKIHAVYWIISIPIWFIWGRAATDRAVSVFENDVAGSDIMFYVTVFTCATIVFTLSIKFFIILNRRFNKLNIKKWVEIKEVIKRKAISIWEICHPATIIIRRLWTVVVSYYLAIILIGIVSYDMLSPMISNRSLRDGPFVLVYMFGGKDAQEGLFGGGWIPSSFLIFIIPIICYCLPKLVKIKAGYWFASIPIWFVWGLLAIKSSPPIEEGVRNPVGFIAELLYTTLFVWMAVAAILIFKLIARLVKEHLQKGGS